MLVCAEKHKAGEKVTMVEKDVTLFPERLDDKCYTSRKTQDHVTIVSLPDGKCMGHILPTDGKAITISKSIIQFLQEKNIIDPI